jgi:DNA-binding NarL/FixJ family response regulator
MRLQPTPSSLTPHVTVNLPTRPRRRATPAPVVPIYQDVAARVRLIVADPDPLSRRVVCDALAAADGIVVAAQASDGIEAAELVLQHRPGVVLAEAGLRRLDGVSLVRQLRDQAPEVRVVIFTVDPDEELALRALRAGAAGVLSKDMELESIGRALQGVARGEAAISRRLALALVEQFRHIPEGFAGMRPVRSPLTPREWEVLDLVSTGATTHDIAAALVLTEDTVYSHVKSILRKLGVHTRAEAVALVEGLRQPLASQPIGASV